MKPIKKNRLKVDAFLLLAGFCIASAAQADEDKGAYIGAAMGKASVRDYCSDTGGLSITSCEDSDTSFKVFGGYRFTRNLAVEVGYVDLGTYHATGSFAGIPFDINTELTGITVQGVGIAPLGDRFSLMGRIGAIRWDLNNSGTVGGFPGGSGDSGVDIAMGVGAQFNFTRYFGIRADLDYYPDLGNSDTGEDDVTAVSIGVVFSF